MLKNASIRAKIYTLLFFAAAAAAVLGGITLYSLRSFETFYAQSAWANRVLQDVGQLRAQQAQLARNMDENDAQDAEDTLADLSETLTANQGESQTFQDLSQAVSAYKNNFGQLKELSLGLKKQMTAQHQKAVALLTEIREKVLNGVEEKKTEAFYEGRQFDDPNLISLSDLSKNLLEEVERFQLNLALLLVFHDQETYRKDQKVTAEGLTKDLKNLGAILGGVKYENLAAAGKAVIQPITEMITTGQALAASWQKSQKVMGEMDALSRRLQELARTFLAEMEAANTASKDATFLASVVVAILAVAGILALGLLIAASITRVLKKGVSLAQAIEKGDLSQRMQVEGQGEVAQLAASLDAMARSLQTKAELAQAIAAGDLSREAVLASDRDTLGLALQEMLAALNDLVGEARDTADQVATSSSQITDSGQALSQGAAEQAASLEEITSSMVQIGSQTTSNADSASQANHLSDAASEAARQGNQQMGGMIEAMGEISESSRSIAKIIKVIDDIAFQTNLLALNAAVEAARAGHHGKGFAVVAEEVRNLASRSAKAAQETSELIEGSVKKVARGTEIAGRTAASLNEITEAVLKVSDLVAEIAAASREQAEGISQINIGLSQVDQVTQQNSANAEETAAAAAELAGQADRLRQMLARFRLSHEAGRRAQASANRSAAALPAASEPAEEASLAGLEELTSDRVVRPQDIIKLDDDEFGRF
ncbi:MAG: HAMP domain-containing protein [Deltaproteobacteria bacterium]|nr:HAMP domain-containing protein [Deltaproteobacteria bacterium]